MSRPISYFETRQRATPDWIIPGLLKRRNTLLMVGEPKRAIKSWLMLNLAWDLAEGKPVWGITHSKSGHIFVPTRPLRVMYFTQEDTEDDLHDRIDVMVKGGRTYTSNLWYSAKNLALCFDNADGVKGIKDAILEATPVDLVIFDTLRRMHYQSENDSDNIAKMWRIIDHLQKEFDCSTILVHHLVKPSKDPHSLFDPSSPHSARGSGDLFGGADAFINVVPINQRGANQNSRLVTLHFENKRSKPLVPTKLRFSFENGVVSFEGFAVGKVDDSEGTPHM